MKCWSVGRWIALLLLFILFAHPVSAPAQITAALTHWQSSQWWRNTATLDMDFINDRYWLNGTQYTAGSGNTGVQNFITGAGATFSRNSVGTYFNSSGILTTASANVPRLDHSPTSPYAPLGILIEESRTNNITNSTMIGFTGWSITRATAATGFSAPDGSTNTTQLTDDQSASTTHSVSTNATSAANTTYVFSAYVKAGTLSWVRLQSGHDSTATYAFFNLSGTGAVGVLSSDNPSAWIQQLSNGWYRCSMAVAMTAAATNSFVLYLSPINNNFGYTGTGTGTTYFWGAQVEAGAFPTSYIPTSGSAVTRAADVFTLPTSAGSGWFNASANQGTLAVNGVVPATFTSALPYYYGLADIDDGTSNNAIQLWSYPPGLVAKAEIEYGAGNFVYSKTATISQSTLIKNIIAFQANNVNSAINGTALGLSTSISIPALSILRVGNLRGGLSPADGWINRIWYMPTRQPDASLPGYTQ